MPLRRDFIRATDQPRVFRGPVGLQFYEEFFEARIELALGAVAVEIQGKIGGRRHTLVYASRLPLQSA